MERWLDTNQKVIMASAADRTDQTDQTTHDVSLPVDFLLLANFNPLHQVVSLIRTSDLSNAH